MRLLIIIGLILITTDIYSCSCERVGVIKGQRSADFVFRGQVVEVNEINTTETVTGTDYKIEYRRIEFTFEVTRVYKGKQLKEFQNQITIITTGGEADCGNQFDKEKEYIVYSFKGDKKLKMEIADQSTNPFMTTHLCTRTKELKPMTFLERFILKIT